MYSKKSSTISSSSSEIDEASHEIFQKNSLDRSFQSQSSFNKSLTHEDRLAKALKMYRKDQLS